MMIISAIVATAHEGVIGKDNEIPWYLPADFAYFKKTTLNHHIIMGRNCYESIGRPLPKRTNIVVTRNPFYVVSGCVVVHSVEEGLRLAERNGEEEVFIIGGGEIYQQTMHLLDNLYLTEVDLDTEGSVFFPEINPTEWDLVSEEKHQKDEKNEWNYTFKIFERKKP
jgi:dihydrofolate reductase